MNSVLRNLVVWFVLGSLLIYVFNNIENAGTREQISYSQFKEELLSDRIAKVVYKGDQMTIICLLYTSPSPRDISGSRMPSSA